MQFSAFLAARDSAQKKVPFCVQPSFQKRTFDLRSTQNSKWFRLKKSQIRSPDGHPAKVWSCLSRIPGGVPEHHFDPGQTRSGGGRRFVGNWKSWTLSIRLTMFGGRTKKFLVKNWNQEIFTVKTARADGPNRPSGFTKISCRQWTAKGQLWWRYFGLLLRP